MLCVKWGSFCFGLNVLKAIVINGIQIFLTPLIHWLIGDEAVVFKIQFLYSHYIDVIMTTMASQFTSLTVVYSTVYSDADQWKHKSSASLAFVRGIHRGRWIPRTKGQSRGKCFHLMTPSWYYRLISWVLDGKLLWCKFHRTHWWYVNMLR